MYCCQMTLLFDSLNSLADDFADWARSLDATEHSIINAVDDRPGIGHRSLQPNELANAKSRCWFDANCISPIYHCAPSPLRSLRCSLRPVWRGRWISALLECTRVFCGWESCKIWVKWERNGSFWIKCKFSPIFANFCHFLPIFVNFCLFFANFE